MLSVIAKTLFLGCFNLRFCDSFVICHFLVFFAACCVLCVVLLCVALVVCCVLCTTRTSRYMKRFKRTVSSSSVGPLYNVGTLLLYVV
jgi:hypothetical protein